MLFLSLWSKCVWNGSDSSIYILRYSGNTGIASSVLYLHLLKLCWQIGEGTGMDQKNSLERTSYTEKLTVPSVLLFSKKER